MGVGFDGVGWRQVPRAKGAESLLLIISNPFEHGLANSAPLGCRECAELFRVQGSFRWVESQSKVNLVVPC